MLATKGIRKQERTAYQGNSALETCARSCCLSFKTYSSAPPHKLSHSAQSRSPSNGSNPPTDLRHAKEDRSAVVSKASGL